MTMRLLALASDRSQFETDAPGACYSACAFAFIGGSWRIASNRSLGVHQHYSEEALAEPNSPKFTAIDISNQQMLDGLIAGYVIEMGVDARFLTLASTTAPTEMYLFTSDEMKHFDITWDDLQYADWTLEPFGDGIIAVSKTKNGKNEATIFCRNDHLLRLAVKSPIHGADAGTEEVRDKIIKSAQVFVFNTMIPTQSITGRTQKGRLLLELKLPSWHTIGDGDEPPREEQGIFEPDAVLEPDGMSAFGATRFFFYHRIPHKQFRTFAKLVGRNCV